MQTPRRVLRLFRSGSTALTFALLSGPILADASFLRGDANADGRLSLSDAVLLNRHLFLGGWRPIDCQDSGDVDDSGSIDVRDMTLLVEHLFQSSASAIPSPETLGPDPTEDSLACTTYEVIPAETTSDLVQLVPVEASPGEEVAVSVLVSNEAAVEAFQLLVAYDPEVFTPIVGRKVLDFSGTIYEGVSRGYTYTSTSAGAGILSIAYTPSFGPEYIEFPAGNETLVFKFRGRISEQAAPGTDVVLELTNGPDGQGIGPDRLLNELTHRGDARYLSTLPRLQGARIGIVGDQAVFIRGDADGNQILDLSDPIGVLGSLFLGKDPLACPDAGDANDDGNLDLTDAIYLLGYLFDSGLSPPAPFPLAGTDPTADTHLCPPAP